MKKICLSLSWILIGALLSSCHYFTWQRSPNPMVEGNYSCANEFNETETIYLNVKKISEKEFEEADGVDVLRDFFASEHYYLECYLSHEDDTKEELHFYNLKGSRDSSYSNYVTYKDDEGSWLWPETASLNVPGNYPMYNFNYTSKYSKRISGNLF